MKRVKSDQKGMVAITVTMILLMIVSLIIIGFATISRREQRQALDKQLSSAAYYAAEAGVNYLADKLQANGITGDTTDCSGTTGLMGGTKTLQDNVEYTCALISQSVDSLEYTIPEGESRVIPIYAEDNIGTIEISWQNSDSTKNTFATNPNHYLPQLSFTTSPGAAGSFTNNIAILRTTVIPITNNMTRDSLMNESQTIFMYPKSDPAARDTDFGTINAGSDELDQGMFLDAKCNINATTTYYCRAKIENINNLRGPTTDTVFLRLKSIHEDSVVRIRVYQLGNDNNINKINGSQAVIDVTARAADVVKRIQARVPLGVQYQLPEYGVQTAGSTCKRIYSWPANIYGPAGFGYNVPDRPNPKAPLELDPLSTGALTDQVCNPTSKAPDDN